MMKQKVKLSILLFLIMNCYFNCNAEKSVFSYSRYGKVYNYDGNHYITKKINRIDYYVLFDHRIRKNPCLLAMEKSNILFTLDLDGPLMEKAVSVTDIFQLDKNNICAVFTYTPDYSVYTVINLVTKKTKSFVATYFWYDKMNRDIIIINYGKNTDGMCLLYINSNLIQKFEYKGKPNVDYYEKGKVIKITQSKTSGENEVYEISLRPL